MPLALSNKPEHFEQNTAATNRWALQVEGDISALKTAQKNAPNVISNVIQQQTNGSSVKVELQVPKEFTPSDQTVSLPGPLKLDWAPELPSTFLAGAPSSGVAGVPALDIYSTSTDVGNTVNTTVTPQVGKGEWALWIASAAGQAINQPAGWTKLFNNPSSSYVNFIETIPIQSTLSLGGSTGTSGSPAWCSAILAFAGVPRVVQTNGPSGVSLATGSGLSGTSTITLSGVSAGNTVMVVGWFTTTFIGGTNKSQGIPIAASCSDNHGNAYSTVIDIFNKNGFTGGGTKVGSQLFCFIAPKIVGTSLTISIPWVSNDTFTSMSGTWGAFELTPISASSGAPFFRAITGQPIGASGDLPLPTTTTVGAVAATGTVAHEFLKSINTDGSATLAQPDFTDLSGDISVSQMDSGTNASATTFWRGDGHWEPVNTSASIQKISTSTYVVLSTDNILEFTNSSASVTLLATNGRWTLTYGGTGTCTISPPGAQTISGFSSVTLIPFQSVDIYYDGTNFLIS